MSRILSRSQAMQAVGHEADHLGPKQVRGPKKGALWKDHTSGQVRCGRIEGTEIAGVWVGAEES